jgi:hypothetical protein
MVIGIDTVDSHITLTLELATSMSQVEIDTFTMSRAMTAAIAALQTTGVGF